MGRPDTPQHEGGDSSKGGIQDRKMLMERRKSLLTQKKTTEETMKEILGLMRETFTKFSDTA